MNSKTFFFIFALMSIILLSIPVDASLTAPTTKAKGYQIWGNYWEGMGEDAWQNGTGNILGNAYVITKSPWNNSYFAINGITGKREYSDLNLSNVTNNTVLVLAATGGLIKFNGSLDINDSSEIYTTDNTKKITLDLTGATINTLGNNDIVFNISGGSVFIINGRINGAVDFSSKRGSLLRSGMGGTDIFVDNVTGLYVSKSGSNWVYESSFSRVNVRNNGHASDVNLIGVDVSTTDVQFYDMEIAKFGVGLRSTAGYNRYDLLHTWGNRDGIRLQGSNDVVSNSDIEDNSRHGLIIASGNNNTIGSGNTFRYNGHGQYQTWVSGTDISIWGTSKNNSVKGNMFTPEQSRYGNSTDYAIQVSDSASVIATDNIIVNNYRVGTFNNAGSGVVVFRDNYGASPYNWGTQIAAPTSPFGALDTYQNSTSGEAFCSYKSSAWQNATGNTIVC